MYKSIYKMNLLLKSRCIVKNGVLTAVSSVYRRQSLRTVIGTSHASQRDDEVFTSKLSGTDAGIVVNI